MRTTLTIADDVYEAAKTLAEGSRKSLGAVISELARRGLRPQAPVEVSEDDLPVFAVRDDAEIIPGGRAADLLDDEGTD